MLPAIVANDRYDVGSHSWIEADGAAVIAVFDRRPGSGFAAGGYDRAEAWLTAARRADRGVPVRERLSRLHPHGGLRVEPSLGQEHRSSTAGRAWSRSRE